MENSIWVFSLTVGGVKMLLSSYWRLSTELRTTQSSGTVCTRTQSTYSVPLSLPISQTHNTLTCQTLRTGFLSLLRRVYSYGYYWFKGPCLARVQDSNANRILLLLLLLSLMAINILLVAVVDQYSPCSHLHKKTKASLSVCCDALYQALYQ